MSRAFVKEPDGEQVADDLPEIPQSTHPNYVTPNGLRLLVEWERNCQGQLARLPQDTAGLMQAQQRKHVARELRYVRERIRRAIVVEAAGNDSGTVAFGCEVLLMDESGTQTKYAIVGEDEADPDQHRISWTSPLATALLNQEVGEVIQWNRPAGNLEMEIVGIRHPA
jgi:transcription elongation GreA/GreB family factor